MDWDYILRDAVKGNTIKELHLRKIPSLKTCEDWKKVIEIGTVDHKTKYAHYRGGLVKYGESIYFVADQRLEAIAPYRTWNFKTKIKVLEPEDPSISQAK